MHAHIYARAYTCSIIYTRTQFAQTNGLTTCTRVYIINASNTMPKPYLYTYVRAYARTRTWSIVNSTRKRTQMHAHKRTQINARKLIVAFDTWAISASKTFRMYYSWRYLLCITSMQYLGHPHLECILTDILHIMYIMHSQLNSSLFIIFSLNATLPGHPVPPHHALY